MTRTDRRSAGRPLEFDPRAVARRALDAFWASGFKDVSVPELERATGVVRTSLYNTFGNKRGLFDAAIDLYLADLYAQLDSLLTHAAGGLDDIHTFLDTLEGWHVSGVPGCFMINSMVEFADSDLDINSRGTAYITRLRGDLLTVLLRAQDNGELHESESIESAADRLLLQTIGLNMAARGGIETDRLRTLYRSAHDAVAALGSKP